MITVDPVWLTDVLSSSDILQSEVLDRKAKTMSYSENGWNTPSLFFAFLYIKILWSLFIQTLKCIQL